MAKIIGRARWASRGGLARAWTRRAARMWRQAANGSGVAAAQRRSGKSINGGGSGKLAQHRSGMATSQLSRRRVNSGAYPHNQQHGVAWQA